MITVDFKIILDIRREEHKILDNKFKEDEPFELRRDLSEVKSVRTKIEDNASLLLDNAMIDNIINYSSDSKLNNNTQSLVET